MSLKQPNNEGLRKFIEKFYIEKKKVNLGLELGAPDYQSDCSTTQATVFKLCFLRPTSTANTKTNPIPNPNRPLTVAKPAWAPTQAANTVAKPALFGCLRL